MVAMIKKKTIFRIVGEEVSLFKEESGGNRPGTMEVNIVHKSVRK